MDISLVEGVDETEAGRSSEESSQGFSFASALALRKNLSETFDQQVSKASSKIKSSGSSNLSVSDRIAQFEKAASTSMRPPLPLNEQSNSIPANRFAVYLRIRPPTSNDEKTLPIMESSTIEVLKPTHPHTQPTKIRTHPPVQSKTSKVQRMHSGCSAKEYEFHQVMDSETTQKEVYTTVAAPLVKGLFEATVGIASKSSNPTESVSALLFAYGITNAGKSHTILGNIKSNNETKWGIVPRAITDLFDRMKQHKTQCYDLHLSYFEVYNEQIFDLIPKKSPKICVGAPRPLKVCERDGQTIVRGLAKHRLRDVSHGIELSAIANSRRQTSSNNLNERSSRSHVICQLQLVPLSRQNAPGKKVSDDDSVISMSGYTTDEEVLLHAKQRSSALWIVDLAGSERSKRTGVASERQKEASLINKSLMTLMRCLSTMRETKLHNSGVVMIPFRESKLTHLFMGHLTSPSAKRTSMIVNANPAIADFDETQHVLAYASQAKTIQLDADELSKKRG